MREAPGPKKPARGLAPWDESGRSVLRAFHEVDTQISTEAHHLQEQAMALLTRINEVRIELRHLDPETLKADGSLNPEFDKTTLGEEATELYIRLRNGCLRLQTSYHLIETRRRLGQLDREIAHDRDESMLLITRLCVLRDANPTQTKDAETESLNEALHDITSHVTALLNERSELEKLLPSEEGTQRKENHWQIEGAREEWRDYEIYKIVPVQKKSQGGPILEQPRTPSEYDRAIILIHHELTSLEEELELLRIFYAETLTHQKTYLTAVGLEEFLTSAHDSPFESIPPTPWYHNLRQLPTKMKALIPQGKRLAMSVLHDVIGRDAYNSQTISDLRNRGKDPYDDSEPLTAWARDQRLANSRWEVNRDRKNTGTMIKDRYIAGAVGVIERRIQELDKQLTNLGVPRKQEARTPDTIPPPEPVESPIEASPTATDHFQERALGIRRSEVERLRAFFGKTIEVPPLPEGITEEHLVHWGQIRFGLQYWPAIHLREDVNLPGWNRKPKPVDHDRAPGSLSLYEQVGKILENERNRANPDLASVHPLSLLGTWVLHDLRSKPIDEQQEGWVRVQEEFAHNTQYYQDDKSLTAILKRLIEANTIASGLPLTGRFNLDPEDFDQIHFWEPIARWLKIDQIPGARVRLPRVIEASVMGQGHDFNDTATGEWCEEYVGLNERLYSGMSRRGGAAQLGADSFRSDTIGFRPLVIFSRYATSDIK